MAQEETPTLPDAIRGRFLLLQGLRAAFFAGITAFIGSVSELGTSTLLLCLAAALGTIVSGVFVVRGRTLRTVAVQHLVAFVLVKLLFTLGEGFSDHFLAYRLWNHVALVFTVYATSLFLTFTFWITRHADTWEATVLATAALWILSGHRNYHLDAPKTVSELAFRLSIEPQHLLIALGLLTTGVIVGYFLVASTRPLFRGEQPALSFGPTRWRAATAVGILLLALLGSYVHYINRLFTANMSRASEGVGQGGEEGKSPLGFHSAVGKTKQPAALVRLEGDFAKNPWRPMLYLREGALSDFNGKEMVLANRSFDTDVPKVGLGEPYVSPFLERGEGREKIVQSIYLLTKHDAPFAIDRPEELRPIQNPDPERFIGAYQALSYAPTIKLDELLSEEVGDPEWNIVTRAHYLRAPGSESAEEVTSLEAPKLDKNREDLRYRRLAHELTATHESPVGKAAAIVQFLSKESIYTRSPGHQATELGDPVAPYLFAPEKRGYCVHFSHAAVYMLRLVGVPARIATGYLTDLTYAKDGHILLHLGDRHAWPEIYIRGRGWVVADITPARAENEQAIIPDEKLLDELMSKLDPAHELVTPPPTAKEDRPPAESFTERLFSRRNLVSATLLLALIFLASKLIFYYGYLLISNPARKLRFAYLAAESRLFDRGSTRYFGETRQEFARRLAASASGDLYTLTTMNEKRLYSAAPLTYTSAEVLQAAQAALRSLSHHTPRLRMVLSFFNPFSLFFVRWR